MYQSVEDTFQYIPLLAHGRDLYEFGVYSGNTLCRLVKGFATANTTLAAVYGFDSFEGLPHEAAGVYYHPDWQPGVFDAREWYGVKTKSEVIDLIQQKVDAEAAGVPCHLIEGWFEHTAVTATAALYGMGPASYLHIDTDLYVSARQALDFCFENGIILPGTLIRYDDWCSVPEWQAGQSLAHLEAFRKYGADAARLSTNVFLVK